MERLNELIRKMVDEAPVEFTETQLRYVKELAKIYAKDCSEASLESASEIVYDRYNGSYECKESITNKSNIKLI